MNTTYLAVLRIRLALPSATLKEKRSIVKSVVARLRTRFNAAIAEIDDLDAVSFATITAVCISNEAAHANAQAQSIANAIEEWRLDAEVLDVSIEVIPL